MGGVLITCHWGGWGTGRVCLNVTPYCWTLMAAGRSTDEPFWVQLRGGRFSNHRSACTSGAGARVHVAPHTCCILTLSGPPILTRRADDPPSPLPPPPANPPLGQFSGGLIAFYYRPNPDISGFIKMGRYAYHELF